MSTDPKEYRRRIFRKLLEALPIAVLLGIVGALMALFFASFVEEDPVEVPISPVEGRATFVSRLPARMLGTYEASSQEDGLTRVYMEVRVWKWENLWWSRYGMYFLLDADNNVIFCRACRGLERLEGKTYIVTFGQSFNGFDITEKD